MLCGWVHSMHTLAYTQDLLCRDLVLTKGLAKWSAAPMDMRLGYLTQLTRLVLQGHTDHFATSDEWGDDFYPGASVVCASRSRTCVT